MSIRSRAIKRVEGALYHWGMSTDMVSQDDLQGGLADIIADLRHWADAKGLDFHYSEARSYRHYLDERTEGREPETVASRCR